MSEPDKLPDFEAVAKEITEQIEIDQARCFTKRFRSKSKTPFFEAKAASGAIMVQTISKALSSIYSQGRKAGLLEGAEIADEAVAFERKSTNCDSMSRESQANEIAEAIRRKANDEWTV